MKHRPVGRAHRNAWEKHHNTCLLPGIHVYHIDGDPFNNEPFNLLAVTRREHFEIHRAQGDHAAAAILSRGLHLSDSELHDLYKELGRQLNAEGKAFASISKERRREIGKYAGKRSKELKAGIHGLDDETRKKNSANAGRACKGTSKTEYTGGQATRDLGVGIHGLSLEERKIYGLETLKSQNVHKRKIRYHYL